MAGQIAEVWQASKAQSRPAAALAWAQALEATAELANDPRAAHELASKIGGLLADVKLRVEACGLAYARTLFHAAAAANDVDPRRRCAEAIEDLLEDAPFQTTAIALVYAQVVYSWVLVDSARASSGTALRSLRAIVQGRSPAASRIASPELGYELAKCILLDAMHAKSPMQAGLMVEVERLVEAPNPRPGPELDEWLTQFASVEHGLEDFALDLLGRYRALRARDPAVGDQPPSTQTSQSGPTSSSSLSR